MALSPPLPAVAAVPDGVLSGTTVPGLTGLPSSVSLSEVGTGGTAGCDGVASTGRGIDGWGVTYLLYLIPCTVLTKSAFGAKRPAHATKSGLVTGVTWVIVLH